MEAELLMRKDGWMESYDELDKRFSHFSEDALKFFHKSCRILAENQGSFRAPQNVTR
jgi:hypothetical protein